MQQLNGFSPDIMVDQSIVRLRKNLISLLQLPLHHNASHALDKMFCFVCANSISQVMDTDNEDDEKKKKKGKVFF